MAKKKEVTKIRPLTEGKKEILSRLIAEYDIKSTEDIQDALKDLLGGNIKGIMEDHLGYGKSERNDNNNYRNGYKTKNVRSHYGEFEVDVP